MDEKELLKKLNEIVLTFEYLGVKFEDETSFDFTNFIIKFSVPEFLGDDIKNQSLFKKYEPTSNGLMKAVKECLIGFIYELVNSDSLFDFNKEEIESQIKFYAKVRKEETWTEEMGKKKLKEYMDFVKEAAEWTEI